MKPAPREKDKERGRKVAAKPGSDFPSTLSADWESDRRVRLQNDRLVGKTAITKAEFKAANA